MDYSQPVHEMHAEIQDVCAHGFVKKADLAQYSGSDYTNAVRVERGISLDQAFSIASQDPDIAYFVYLKGGCMVLPIDESIPFDPKEDLLGLVSHVSYHNDSDDSIGFGGCRVFHHGDAVFFKQDGIRLGSASGLADTYIKD